MMLTKEECLEALTEIKMYGSINIPLYSLEAIENLIKEHFDNPQIDWLKNCMGEEAFNLIFSSQEEVNKWFDRMRWHVKKCDEYGRELDILKNNPPLKCEERVKFLEKQLDIAIKDLCLTAKGADACNSLDVLYEGIKEKIEEQARKEVQE